MSYSDHANYLLIANYDALNLSDRLDAVQAAYTAGGESARADRGAAGGFDQPTVTADTYHGVVAEPALIALEGAEAGTHAAAAAAAYQRITDADPRVRAFREGWATEMRDAAEAARENGDDSAALTEFIAACEAELASLSPSSPRHG